jgi:hypothetical protein
MNYNKTLQFVPSIDFYSGDISARKGEAVINQSNWNDWNWCPFNCNSRIGYFVNKVDPFNIYLF